MKYESVIGLEVHVELKTKTKIFCGCSTEFGAEPNTHVCPVCLGLPGSMPVLNKEVLHFAIKAGLALHCDILPYSKFDRKNYYYPDLPKNFQTSQYDLPICLNGYVDIEVGGETRRIRLTRIHMEEDAGKLVHSGASIDTSDNSFVDYNRTGVPLLEIVGEPDLRSGEEARAYLEKLRSIMQYLGVSDCRLQEGSMRADVNLSVREVGSPVFGTRTEMKNLNSFKAIAHAIEGERERQIELLEEGRAVVQETRRWDDNKESSHAMRSKEDAKDYRYFPDPDLPPIDISDAWIASIRAAQPELKKAKSRRYQSEYGLSAYDADILTGDKALAELFENPIKAGAAPKKAANWLTGETLRLLKEKESEASKITFTAEHLASLIALLEKSVINNQTAKDVFAVMFESDVDPAAYVEEHGLKMESDSGLLEETVKKILDANPKAVGELKEGKDKVIGFLMGQVMKEMKGKANPSQVSGMIHKLVQE